MASILALHADAHTVARRATTIAASAHRWWVNFSFMSSAHQCRSSSRNSGSPIRSRASSDEFGLRANTASLGRRPLWTIMTPILQQVLSSILCVAQQSASLGRRDGTPRVLNSNLGSLDWMGCWREFHKGRRSQSTTP